MCVCVRVACKLQDSLGYLIFFLRVERASYVLSSKDIHNALSCSRPPLPSLPNAPSNEQCSTYAGRRLAASLAEQVAAASRRHVTKSARGRACSPRSPLGAAVLVGGRKVTWAHFLQTCSVIEWPHCAVTGTGASPPFSENAAGSESGASRASPGGSLVDAAAEN